MVHGLEHETRRVRVRVHRSTTVNLAHLAGTQRDTTSRLFLRGKDGNAELPLSRAYVHLFKATQARH